MLGTKVVRPLGRATLQTKPSASTSLGLSCAGPRVTSTASPTSYKVRFGTRSIQVASRHTTTRPISTEAAKTIITHASPEPDDVVDSYLKHNVFDLLSLKDRVTVVTGGARGIGFALGYAGAEAGSKIAIIDAAPEPSETYAKLQEISPEVRYYQSDVTDYDRLEGTFSDIVKDFGRIDGLITAAGICPDEPFLERSPASVKKCLEINTLGSFYSAQLAARQMVEQRPLENAGSSGSIVFIASMAAHRASKGQYVSDYCMSKGALLSLAKELSVELGDSRVRTNCISPGYMMTDMAIGLIKQRPDLGQIWNQDPPLNRMGNRTDLKAAAVYLLSDASAYMTGAELLISGGLHAGTLR